MSAREYADLLELIQFQQELELERVLYLFLDDEAE
jgi:hypothetical protein